MTDRDPARPRRTPKATAPTPDPAAGGSPRAAAPRGGSPTGAPSAGSGPASTALRDRWWWSPTLVLVVGLVVIGYQLEPLRSSDAVWGNWVVAALGLAVAVHGAVQLLRAHRSR